MKKIILVIGGSATGKTTFIKKEYLTLEHKNIEPKKLIKCCVNESTILLGHYNIDKRCEGTDTLSYAALPKLIEYLPTIINKYDLLVAEGDRINNKKFFDLIKSFNIPVEVYYFTTSLQNSLQRRVASGSNSSRDFVRTTITKSVNMLKYATFLGFTIIRKRT
jgi:predicted kinase